jgi:hypothetical protein
MHPGIVDKSTRLLISFIICFIVLLKDEQPLSGLYEGSR